MRCIQLRKAAASCHLLSPCTLKGQGGGPPYAASLLSTRSLTLRVHCCSLVCRWCQTDYVSRAFFVECDAFNCEKRQLSCHLLSPCTLKGQGGGPPYAASQLSTRSLRSECIAVHLFVAGVRLIMSVGHSSFCVLAVFGCLGLRKCFGLV